MGESSLKEKSSHGLFWGGASSFLRQFLNMFFGLFLARLLTPSDYGMVGMLAVFSALGIVIPNSGFGAALINRKTICYEEYNAVFWFNMGLAIIFYFILFLSAPLIARFFHTPELVTLSRWYFLSFVITSAGIAPLSLLIKQLKVKERAIANIVALVISGCIGLFVAYKGLSYWALVIQSLVWGIINVFFLYLYSGWLPSFKINFKPIKEMWRFSIKLLITSVVQILNFHFFSVVFGRLYSEKEVGYYTQANKWSDLGSSTVKEMMTSIAQPVFVEVADDPNRQLRIIRKMIRFASFVSFPALFGLAFVAPEFITIALTDKWLKSAEMLRVLCIFSAFIPINEILSNLIISKGKSSVFMWVNISLFVALFATMLLTHSRGMMWMIVCYTIVNILWTGIWLIQVRRIIPYKLKQFIRDILPYLGTTVVLIVGTYFITCSINNVFFLLCSKILIFTIAYIFVMWKSGSVAFRESANFFLKKLRRRTV